MRIGMNQFIATTLILALAFGPGCVPVKHNSTFTNATRCQYNATDCKKHEYQGKYDPESYYSVAGLIILGLVLGLAAMTHGLRVK